MDDGKGECAECGGFFGPTEWVAVWCDPCRKTHRSCPHCKVPLEFPSIAAVLAIAREEHDAE